MLSADEQGKTSMAKPGEEHAGEETASVAASERPLVVVIENTEAADMLALQDLILVLSEVSFPPSQPCCHHESTQQSILHARLLLNDSCPCRPVG